MDHANDFCNKNKVVKCKTRVSPVLLPKYDRGYSLCYKMRLVGIN
jgi:hypothetical protein